MTEARLRMMKTLHPGRVLPRRDLAIEVTPIIVALQPRSPIVEEPARGSTQADCTGVGGHVVLPVEL